MKAILNKSIGLKNFLDGFMKFEEIYTQKEESLYNHIYLLNRKVQKGSSTFLSSGRPSWLLIIFWGSSMQKTTEIKAEGFYCQVALCSNGRWTGLLREVCEEQQKGMELEARRMSEVRDLFLGFSNVSKDGDTNALCGCALCSWWKPGGDWVSVMSWQAEKQKEVAEMTRRI